MSPLPGIDEAAVLRDLRDLAEVTSDAAGAQRVAWGPIWRQARHWFEQRAATLGLDVETDAAGNRWVSVAGRDPDAASLVLGGHLDSVPNGGWLDGSLGLLASFEALRRYRQGEPPPATLHLVDWADEEGARFGRSLLGSSAAAGSLLREELEELQDADGISLVAALRENGVDPDRMGEAHEELLRRRGGAYLELHIEQGPVLEAQGLPTAVVVGTFGVERHAIRFTGQAAHSGSTPLPMRRDALLAAAELALAGREIARRHSGDSPETRVVSTCGQLRLEPGIVTAVPGVAEISLDQRALDAGVLASMLEETRAAATEIADRHRVAVEWRRLWSIEPRAFDPRLVELCEKAVRQTSGEAPRLPSGPLHDAAEMVPLMPTVMMFSASRGGLSHCKEEDTSEEDLRATIRAFVTLVDEVAAWLPASGPWS